MITGIKKAASCSLLTPNRTPSVQLNPVKQAPCGGCILFPDPFDRSIEAQTHTISIFPLEGPTPVWNVAGLCQPCSTLPAVMLFALIL